MMQYDSEEAIVQNLEDAGCGFDVITAFINDMKSGNKSDGLKLLAKHRRLLLDHLHEKQKQIDCLDYLVYQMEKGA